MVLNILVPFATKNLNLNIKLLYAKNVKLVYALYVEKNSNVSGLIHRKHVHRNVEEYIEKNLELLNKLQINLRKPL